MDMAEEHYHRFESEMRSFLHDYVKGMIVIGDPEIGHGKIRLPHPSDNYVQGTPKVLVGQIIEHLRAVLDYMVYEMSVANCPELDERKPQFVIAESSGQFRQQSGSGLKYLTPDQVDWLENMQPYRGNWLLQLINDLSRSSKHRHLISVRNATSLDIVYAESEKRNEFEGYFEYSHGNGSSTFAKPSKSANFVLLNKWDGMPALRFLIRHTALILHLATGWFEGKTVDPILLLDPETGLGVPFDVVSG